MYAPLTDTKKAIIRHLQRFGLDSESTQVYLLLTQKGPQTVLNLSRETGIKRTQVYRLLEELQAKQLVSADHLTYGSLYQAMPLEQLEAVIIDKSLEVQKMRSSLSDLGALMADFAGKPADNARVLHYSGVEGLKQVSWNLTKAQDHYKVFEVSHLSDYLDKRFAMRCRERFVERGLTSYDLTNDTKVLASGIEPFNPDRTHYASISKDVLDIQFEVYIYNDVVTLLDYSGEQVFCMEIYHRLLNKLAEQLFDVAWSQAKHLEITP